MNLNFFTAKFPFIGGEAIIENELPIVSQAFVSVKIFPHVFSNQTDSRKVESNCVVNQINSFNTVKLTFYYKKLIFIFFFTELFKTKKVKFYVLNFKKWLSLLKVAAKKAQFIEDHNLLLPNSVNYTYWMNDWALVLVFLKRKKVINNFVFRCGGFDIWDERHEGNYLPFRYLIYKYADYGFPNSKIAKNYMKNKTPFGNKIKLGYLGTNDYGISKLNKGNPFTIVSVSSVIPLKRVGLITEILKSIKMPIRWIHFGDGSELESVKAMSINKLQHHSVEFKGNVNNSEIIEYYKTNSVNLFITTSSTESLPVSIQEAISFGIPVLATNVGGVSEIVNNTTGYLLEKDFDVKEVAKLIDNFENSIYNTIEKRKEIRQFWKDNFEAKKVYSEFAKQLKQITQ